MASQLELEAVPGMRTMANLPVEERLRLVQERERAIEMLANRHALLPCF